MWYKVLLKDKDGKFITDITEIPDYHLRDSEDVGDILKTRFGNVYNWRSIETKQDAEKYSFDAYKYGYKTGQTLGQLSSQAVGDKSDPVSYCQTHYPEMCKEFQHIQRKQYELLCKKQMDYGPGNIAVGTQLKDDREIMASLKAIIVRANDKMQRLVNLILINNREPSNESVEDTFMDLAVYSTIAMVVKNGKWGK